MRRQGCLCPRGWDGALASHGVEEYHLHLRYVEAGVKNSYEEAPMLPRLHPPTMLARMPAHAASNRVALFRFCSGLGALSLFTMLVSGCGHPASHAECEEILDRVIDLELKERKVSDEEIAKRREATREARGAELLGKCENRRITDGAMRCIRGATSVDQITNQCLR